MKQLKFLPIFLFLGLLACQSKSQSPESATGETAAPYTDIDVTAFKAKMADDVVVLDVRTPAEIADGKITGAMEMDFRADGFDGKLDNLDKEKTYLVYCRSGGRSSNACKMMSEKGFKNLYNLKGGYTAWSKEK